jgi:hypothetical protein
MNELLAWAMWAALSARIAFLAFWGQVTTLATVMRRVRPDNLSAWSLPAVLALLLVAPVSQAVSLPGRAAAGSGDVDRVAAGASAFDGISLDEAVSRAERQYRARVVRTDVQDEDGRKVYVLKLLSEDGRVFTVRIDAATGRMR